MKNPFLKPFAFIATVTLTFTMSNPAGAATIGFVAGLTGGALDQPFDQAWKARLEGQGHTVLAIDQNTTSANVPAVDLFIISSDIGSGNLRDANKIGLQQPKSYIVYEQGNFPDFFGGGGGTTGAGSHSITITDPASPLAANLTGNVIVYSGASKNLAYSNGTRSANADVVANRTGAAGDAVPLVLEAGEQGGSNGTTTFPAKRIGVFCYADWPDGAITASGWALLDAAVTYGLPEVVNFDHLAVGTNAASPHLAGTPFDVTITAQDINNVTVPNANGTVTMNTTPSGSKMEFDWNNDGIFGDKTGKLENGTKVIKARNLKAETVSITATAGTANTTLPPSVTTGPTAFVKLQILAPGETAAPGTATGKTGTPTIRTLSIPFNVTVNAVDEYWNPAITTDTISITSSDASAVLPAPSVPASFSVTLNTVGAFTVTATDSTDGAKTAATTPLLTVLGAPITWVGDDATNKWDTSTTNWIDGATPPTAVAFSDTNQVSFLSTGSAFPAVDIVGTVQPSKITVNSTQNFTFGGSGSIAGLISGDFIKSGTGTLTLETANTYTAKTSVSGGILILANANALPATTSNLSLSNAVLGLAADDFIRSPGLGGDQINLNNNSGFAAFDADRVVNLGGASAPLTWGANNFLSSGDGTLVLNSSSATHTLDFQNPIAMGTGVRFFNVGDAAADVDAILSGAITGGSIGFSKTGAGTLVFKNTGNAYNGQTFIDSGTLILGASGVIPNGSAVTVKKANNATAEGILDLNGFDETIAGLNLGEAGPNAIAQTPTVINSSSTAATLTLGGNLNYNAGASGILNGAATISVNLDTGTAGNRNITVGDGLDPEDLVISGNLTGGAITKLGLGILALSNAKYTGNTTISDGTLTLSAANPNNDASIVSIAAGKVLNLTYAGTDKVGGLVIGTTVKPDGVYGKADSVSPIIGIPEITGDGTLTVVNDPYATWAGVGVPFDGDANSDGVKNGLAWLLGAANPTVNALDLLPDATQSGGNLTMEFDCKAGADRGTALLSLQHSSDLGLNDMWATVAVPGIIGNSTVDNVTFVVTDPDPVGGPLHVVATIQNSQAAAGRIFGRLRAEK